jgi:hypothetical protein
MSKPMWHIALEKQDSNKDTFLWSIQPDENLVLKLSERMSCMSWLMQSGKKLDSLDILLYETQNF